MGFCFLMGTKQGSPLPPFPLKGFLLNENNILCLGEPLKNPFHGSPKVPHGSPGVPLEIPPQGSPYYYYIFQQVIYK